MTALAIPANFHPAVHAPSRLDTLATKLRRWRRVVRDAAHGDHELKLFGAPRGDGDPELATLFLRYPPI